MVPLFDPSFPPFLQPWRTTGSSQWLFRKRALSVYDNVSNAFWLMLQAAQGEVKALNGSVVEAFEAYRRQRPQLDELMAEARRHADAAARAPQELPPLPDGPSEVTTSPSRPLQNTKIR